MQHPKKPARNACHWCRSGHDRNLGLGFPLNCACPADELQIHWVDLLKVDIEGAEWKVLESMLNYYNGQLPFTQLQVRYGYGIFSQQLGKQSNRRSHVT